MRTFLSAVIFSVTVAVFNFTNAANVEIAYWNGDPDFPIWVERDDNSKVVFKISSARELDAKFTQNRKLILFDVYDIESNGRIIEHLIGPNGGYGLFYNNNTFVVFYPESRRFPEGQQIEIENPYQIKICKILINESYQHDKMSMPGR